MRILEKFTIVFVLFASINYSVNRMESKIAQGPVLKIEIFRPRGLRVSMSDDGSGIKILEFHANINTRFNGKKDPGLINLITDKSVDGYWILDDDDVQIKVGNTLFYWLDIKYDFGSNVEFGSFVVKELLTRKGFVHYTTSKPIEPNTQRTKSTKTTTKPTTTTAITTSTKPVIIPVCEPTVTKVRGVFSCKGKLIFSEEFDENQIDSTKWTAENRIALSPDYSFVSYQDKSENLFVANGILNIVPTLVEDDRFIKSGTLDLRASCSGWTSSDECFQVARSYLILPPVISARVNSLPAFSFQYGKVEVRAKLPAGDWIYPEIYLLPKYYEYGPDYSSGKIWISFSRGNKQFEANGMDFSSKVLSAGYVLGRNEPLKSFAVKSNMLLDGMAWNDNFHIYTLIWQPGEITVQVDSTVYGKISIPNGGFKTLGDKYADKHITKWINAFSPFDKEFHIVLGVGVGGMTDFPEADDKPWKNKDPKALLRFYRNKDSWYSTWDSNSARMKVDYVRVWAI